MRCVDYSDVKAMAVVLDSELFSCRYTQTQCYTLTTPTGSCGSKNERPNNTHLNLRGTQVSPVFLELHRVWLHLPLKLYKSFFFSFLVCILRCLQYCMVFLICDPRSPLNMVKIRPQGPCEPIQKHLLVCTAPPYRLFTFPDIPSEIVIKFRWQIKSRFQDDGERGMLPSSD